MVDIEYPSFWLRKYPSIASDYLVHPYLLQRLGDAKSILDVGCGNGHFTETLAVNGAKVVAIDKSSLLIDMLSRKKTKVDYRVGDITETCYSEKFEIALSSLSLLFLNKSQLSKAYSNIYSALCSSGRALISTVNSARETEQPFSQQITQPLRNVYGEEIPVSYFHHSTSTYAKLAEQAGFVVSSITYPSGNIPESLQRSYATDVPLYVVLELQK